eukprot:COSAG06_NODE_37384_length_435_cov_6.693452_1_plen_51_part_00
MVGACCEVQRNAIEGVKKCGVRTHLLDEGEHWQQDQGCVQHLQHKERSLQ